jgi:hypothetical protein
MPFFIPRRSRPFHNPFTRNRLDSEGIALSKKTSVTKLSAAAAHHRLLWIHPFLDGIGRVARLMSHASLLETLDTGGIWSAARGLARNVAAYRAHLANCDLQRRNDLDGRGNLSEEALIEFTRFFLEVCIDQVRFMEELVQPERLHTRILLWTEEEIRLGLLPPKSGNVLEAVLYRGELPRGDAAALVATGERQARRIVAALIEKGVLTSESARAPLRLTFPATLAPRWMPGLFPEKSHGQRAVRRFPPGSSPSRKSSPTSGGMAPPCCWLRYVPMCATSWSAVA